MKSGFLYSVLFITLIFSLSEGSFTAVNIVKPAAPALVSSVWEEESSSTSTSNTPSYDREARRIAVASCYGECSSTSLFSKKKKDSPGAGGGKKAKTIMVQLLKPVAGTGNVGDVVFVAPAFFEHKLKKTKSAKRVTEEEIREQTRQREAQQAEMTSHAQSVADKLKGYHLEFNQKAGPQGNLFGAIRDRDILAELEKQFPEDKDILAKKTVKVLLSATDGNEDGAVERFEIKHLGDFNAKISLHSGITADMKVSVLAP